MDEQNKDKEREAGSQTGLPKSKRPDVKAMIAKAAEGTRQVFSSTILTPIIPGSSVRVRIQGVVAEFKVDKQDFQGWGIVQPVAPGLARFVQEASPQQIRAYMEILPRFEMVLLRELDHLWWAVPAHADNRLASASTLPVRLPSRVQSFDTIATRFDGTSFWFESQARRRNPKVAMELRQALNQEVFPEDLRVKEMTPSELLAYALLFYEQHPDLIVQDAPTEEDSGFEKTFDYEEWLKTFEVMHAIKKKEDEVYRLKCALQHAGAALDSYWRTQAKDEEVNVKIRVDGDEHIARVNAKSLEVVSAGICLSGDDAHFDLTSLVGVLREYKRGHSQF